MKLRRARSQLLSLGSLLALAVTVLPATARAAEPSLRVDLGGGVTLDLVLVQPGSFTQGSPPGEKGREGDEAQRQVTISKPYYLGKFPVTVGQFTRFTGASGYRTEAEKGSSGGSGWDGQALVQRKDFNWKNPGFAQTAEHPVTLVTYDDALAFTSWASRTSGQTLGLPTEAQWEYAYRAGGKGAYGEGAGDKDAAALGWFKENALGGTHPVGKKKANAWGLHDMAGNVFEWCDDWYGAYLPGAATDPRVTLADPSDKPRRVLRGGSWLKEARHGRAAARYRNTPGSRNADNGFRVVAAVGVAPPPSPAATEPAPSPPPSSPATKSSARQPASGAGGGGGSLGGVAFMSALLLMVVGVLAFASRRSRGHGAGVSFRMAADGFWIDAPGNLARATLHYRHRGASGMQEGHVVLEPSKVGQFVYTGAAPQRVELVRLIRPEARTQGRPQGWHRGRSARRQGGDAPRPMAGPVVHQHHHHQGHQFYQGAPSPPDERRDDDGFRGFPSAY